MVSETNPLTQAITAKNANSDLLRLPQEIKQLIYENILGRHLIHICEDPKRPGYSFTHYLCQARHSEKEAERIFAASKEPWFSIDIENRHGVCCLPSARDSCPWCGKQNDIAIESHAQLSLAFLRCCRQMYQEARSIIFSNCTFSFVEPTDIGFLYDITGCQIIRSLHLDIMIYSETVEYWWSETFKQIISHIKSLQHIYINIDLHPEDTQQISKWRFKEPAECCFLEGLHTLIDLKLKTATVIISDSHWLLSDQRDGAERWTMLKKQEWAGYTKRVLLHQEEEEQPDVGEVV